MIIVRDSGSTERRSYGRSDPREKTFVIEADPVRRKRRSRPRSKPCGRSRYLTSKRTRRPTTTWFIEAFDKATGASAGQSLDTVELGEVAIERPHRHVPGLARNLDDQAV